MKRSELTNQIDDFRRSITAAQKRVGQLEAPREENSALFEELLIGVEELQVADEELHAQDEALQAAYTSLEISHKHYHALFEEAPWAYFVTDLNGIVREANLASSRLINIDRQHLIGKPLSLYVYKADHALFRQQLSSLSSSSEVSRWEMTVAPRHRTPLIPVSVTCVRVVEGFDTYLRWMFYDLTLQKQAEEDEREKVFRSSFDQAGVGMAYLTPQGNWKRVNKVLADMLGYSREELQATDYRDQTFSDDILASVDAHLSLLSRQTENVTFEKRFQRKDGSIFWASVNSSLIIDSNQRALYIISVIEDITARKQAEMLEKAKRATAELLQATAMDLNSSLQLSEVLDLVLQNLRNIVAYDAACVLFLRGDEVSVVHQCAYETAGLNDLESALKEVHIPAHIFERLTANRPLTVDLELHHEIFAGLPQIESIQSALFVPLIQANLVVGYLLLQSCSSDAFAEANVSVLRMFADQAVAAIQNARLYQASQELAVLKERQRVARDLHDSVSQSLFSSIVITQTLSRLSNLKQEISQDYLDDLEMLNRSAMAEMRLLLLELRPDQLHKMNLQERVVALIEASKGRKTLDFGVHIDPQEGIAPEVLVVFFRVIQEAVNNIIKHSLAKHITINLHNLGDQVTLSIQDDGVGFDVKEVKSGFGLSSMSERAREVGAELSITSHKDEGTEVNLVWKKPDPNLITSMSDANLSAN